MAKATNVSTQVQKYSAEQVKDFMNDILVGKETPISWQECFALLKDLPDEALTELSGGDMIEWIVGKTTSFSFEGFDTTTIDGKSVRLAKLRYEDGKLGVTSATMAVNALTKVTQLPAFVKIICEGKEKGKGGEYFILRVRTF